MRVSFLLNYFGGEIGTGDLVAALEAEGICGVTGAAFQPQVSPANVVEDAVFGLDVSDMCTLLSAFLADDIAERQLCGLCRLIECTPCIYYGETVAEVVTAFARPDSSSSGSTATVRQVRSAYRGVSGRKRALPPIKF